MNPMRRLDRSWSANDGSFKAAMSIVGTPYSAIQRSAATAASIAAGSNEGEGMTTHAPWVAAARFPQTIPKQW